jgi:hypothetical protein
MGNVGSPPKFKPWFVVPSRTKASAVAEMVLLVPPQTPPLQVSPVQHVALLVQAWPAVPQVEALQTLLMQIPEQQAALLAQAAPLPPHVGAQTPPVQTSDAQQVCVPPQAWPAELHVEAAQTPFVQIPEQQFELLLHAAPLAPQLGGVAQTPAVVQMSDGQHDWPAPHAWPAEPHDEPVQVKLKQLPEQHAASLAHAAPPTLQVGLPQTPPVQTSDAQQVCVPPQAWPAELHVEAAQTPFVQIPEQQFELLLQAAPLAPQLGGVAQTPAVVQMSDGQHDCEAPQV